MTEAARVIPAPESEPSGSGETSSEALASGMQLSPVQPIHVQPCLSQPCLSQVSPAQLSRGAEPGTAGEEPEGAPVREPVSGPRVSEIYPLMGREVVAARYDLIEVVGRGATSLVHRAWDRETEREVAVQLLSEHHPARDRLRTRFMRTSHALLQLDHPAVVRYFAAGNATEEIPYLVMELLRGETLGQFLERERVMAPEVALPLFCQAAAGLIAAHQAELVHRDVKPDNLYLEGPIGRPQTLRVIDFGLAKPMNAPQSESLFVVGTLEYLPPEQAVCDPVDARSDVYSLGVVMFRALTGELPFDVEREARMLAHHIVSPAPPPSWLVDTLPVGMEHVILNALRKHPENRYPTMMELLADLERIQAGRGDQVAPLPWKVIPDCYEARGEESGRAVKLLGSALHR